MAPEKLPNFSFPMVPRTSSESQSTSTAVAMETFSPIAVEASRPSKHRRNNAMSLRRHGMLIHTASPTSNPSIPPVPKVPQNLQQHRHPLSALESQPLARSLSDVSSCPTLEADNDDETLTPDSVHELAEVDYFNFKSFIPAKSATATSEPQLSKHDSSAYDADESDPSDAQELTEDDDDDDDEFFHCRGLAGPAESAFDVSGFVSRQSKDSDKAVSGELFPSNEDALECYSDYEHWLRSIAHRTKLFDMSNKAGVTSPSFNDYMGIIRYPLLA